MVQVEFGGYLVLALCLLCLPLRWVMGILLASAVHELFHLASLRVLHVKIHGVRIGAGGVVIRTEPMAGMTEAICALAGPLGSFSMVLIAEYFPEAALIGLCQGTYNLLPIYPLDGGRVLRNLVSEAAAEAVGIFVWILLLGGGMWLWLSCGLGVFTLFPAFWTGLLLIRGKIPCKDFNLAVQ